jgi:hypothetical protein
MTHATHRTLLLALAAALAACGDAAERPSAAAPAASPSAPQAAAPAASSNDADLPEAGDPRRFLDTIPLRWADWERNPPADRAARLRELGITPIRRDSVTGPVVDGYDPDGERVQDFHFVDFSGDGVADVIYDGAWFAVQEGNLGALEGTRVKLYHVIGGRGVPVAEHHGSVQRIWKGRPGEPLSFRTMHHGCCADPQWSLTFFRPRRRGDTLGYEPYRNVMGREDLEIPKQFMATPQPFTVNQDGYLLRSTPRIAGSAAGWLDGTGGNAMAAYGSGARGTAVAERRDSTGRVWWFVRMDGRTPPREAQFEDDPNSRTPTDRLGWMSSRFLSPAP